MRRAERRSRRLISSVPTGPSNADMLLMIENPGPSDYARRYRELPDVSGGEAD
jgi:hypothetical protein